MLKKLEIDKKAHQGLIKYCKMKKIQFLSTAFDNDSINLLEELNLPLYKIPSGEITNLPYLRRIGSMGKPIILSTGMSTMLEIKDALGILISAGAKKREITVLHCNTEYPTPMKDVNLKAMLTMGNELGVNIGYSDHTLGIEVPIAAVAMGAKVIEKHFTLARAEGGVDSAFSLEPEEMAALVVETERAWQALGKVRYGPTDAESKSLVFRRSIYISKDISAGELFDETNVRIVRPGDGAPPYLYSELIGKPARRNYSAGTPLSFEQLL